MNMNEKEFRAWYQAKQQNIATPNSLKQKVLAQAVQQSATSEATYRQGTVESDNHGIYDSCQPEVCIPSTRRDLFRGKRHWVVPAAACAAALAVAICAPMVVSGMSGTSGQDGKNQATASYMAASPTDHAATTPQADHSLFNVCAYASSLDSFIPAEDGIIRFSLDMNLDRQTGQTNDWYPGAVFVLEGEGIERVQATLSNGELCRYTFEDLTRSEDQEKMTEILGWKPTSRGFGEYYGSFDNVEVLPASPDLDKLDPNYQFKTRLIKRYGSTVDIEINPDEPTILGMWFDASNFPLMSDGSVDLAALEGETLTITAQFADGSAQTQVIELHKGTFKQESIDYLSETAEDAVPTGAPLSEVDGHYVDEAGNVVDEEATVTTLYGEIISTTNEPHPCPLDHANEHANAVVAVDQSEFEAWLDRGQYQTLNGLPVEEQFAASGVVSSSLFSTEDENGEYHDIPVEIRDVSLEFSSDLPAEMNFDTDTELAAYLGQFDYMNYILQARDGFTVDENGTICGGFKYGIVRATLTNPSDTAVECSLGVPAVKLGILDEANNQLLLSQELFGNTATAAPDGGSGLRGIILNAGESCTLTYAFVLPDEAIAAGNPVLLGTGFVDLEAITETSQLTDVQFLKL